MKSVGLLLVAAMGLGFAATPSLAGSASGSERITACSKNGHFTCATAVAFDSRVGRKMRLQHGTVVDCDGDCRDTLRRTTVDVWDDRRENY